VVLPGVYFIRMNPVVLSMSRNPYLNLAFEEHLMAETRPGRPSLFLCRNRPSVVIGRNQNPWVEADLSLMAADGVDCARRVSGGGTVYHDPGNLNYGMVMLKEEYDQDRCFACVIEALVTLGINARRSGRNDLLLGDLKISGSAFRHSGGRSLHHGTLLVSSDLARLGRYLRPPQYGIVSKGTSSVRSPVTNLTDAGFRGIIEDVETALARVFMAWYYPGVSFDFPVWTDDQIRSIPEVQGRAEELASWDWVFGRCPVFTLPVGTAELTVRHARIVGVCRNGEPDHMLETEFLGRSLRNGLNGLNELQSEVEEVLLRLSGGI
jgi:lipoate---protein ligase